MLIKLFAVLCCLAFSIGFGLLALRFTFLGPSGARLLCYYHALSPQARRSCNTYLLWLRHRNLMLGFSALFLAGFVLGLWLHIGFCWLSMMIWLVLAMRHHIAQQSTVQQSNLQAIATHGGTMPQKALPPPSGVLRSGVRRRDGHWAA